MRLSVIIPTLNEASLIESTLAALQPFRTVGHELIVADGASSDATVALARPWVDRVIQTPRGRAKQMNYAATIATGEVLVFVHADTRLPPDAIQVLEHAFDDDAEWTYFQVRLSGSHPLFRLVELFMNVRSRASGIATGDQCLSIRRDVFQWCGGFPDIPLMEDVELCRRLKIRGWYPRCLRQKVITSSRRWEQGGVLRTILFMWGLRLAYFYGADPQRLAARYNVQIR